MYEERFNELFEKYKQQTLTSGEYREFLTMLNAPEAERNLDSLLTEYWQSMEAESGFQPINVPASGSGISNQPTRHKYRAWWGIAASILVLVGVFIFIWNPSELLGSREMVYETGYGERLEIELDDGSHITLNANSELRWKENWKKNESREAILTGEAFFEVEKQNGIPFTVTTDDVVVEVLGTSFNVDSREGKTEVYLDEGKVNLWLKEDQIATQQGVEKEIVMKPGDRVQYVVDEDKLVKTEGQTMITAASWKKNVLNFKNMEFREVLELLRDIYGQSFECDDGELLTTPMYIGVPYADWDAVRQALELSLNIRFEKTAPQRYDVRSRN